MEGEKKLPPVFFAGSGKFSAAVVVGELYRHSGEWKFNAIGSGFKGGLSALCQTYGVRR